MDGRDLARCLALEAHNDTHAYTVSMESGAVYGTRHLNANFNRGCFVKEAKRKWGESIKFRQIVLDYFWIPRGSWVMTHWSRSFFETTLPGFVEGGMLDFSKGSPRVDQEPVSSGTGGGGDVYHSTDNEDNDEDNTDDNIDLDESTSSSNEWDTYTQLSNITAAAAKASSSGMGACSAVVYLPFCLHCAKQVVAAIDTLSQYYTISFLYRWELFENSLWLATSTIDANAMQNWLGKARDQEETYCTFGPSEFLSSADDAYVSKEDVLEVLRCIEDFKYVRMIKLKALKIHDPNYAGPAKKRKRSKVSSRSLWDSSNKGIDQGGFVGLKHPDEVVRGFDYERMRNKKDDNVLPQQPSPSRRATSKTASKSRKTSNVASNDSNETRTRKKRKDIAVVSPSPMWIPSALTVTLDNVTLTGSVEAEEGEYGVLAGHIDKLYSEIDPVAERLKNEPCQGNLMCSWNDEDNNKIDDDDDDQLNDEDDDNVEDDDDSDESGNEGRNKAKKISALDVREIVDTHQEKLMTVCKEMMNQTPSGEIIIEPLPTDVGKRGSRSDDDGNGEPIGVICEAQTDKTHKSIEIMETQKLDVEGGVGTRIDDKKIIALHDASNNEIDGPQTAINESELGKDLRQLDNEGDEGTEIHKLIVKECESNQIDVGSKGIKNISDVRQLCHKAGIIGNRVRVKAKEAPQNEVKTCGNITKEKLPVFDYECRISHVRKSAEEQCRISKLSNLAIVLDEEIISDTVQATEDSSEGLTKRSDLHYDTNVRKKIDQTKHMSPLKENKGGDEIRASDNEEQCCAESGILDSAIGTPRSSLSHEYSQQRTIFRLPTMVPKLDLANTDEKHEVNCKPKIGSNAIINQEGAACGTQTVPPFSRGQYDSTALSNQLKHCKSPPAPFTHDQPLAIIGKTDLENVNKPCTVSEQSEDYLDDESVASLDTLCSSQGRLIKKKEIRQAAANALVSMRNPVK